jgi:broad specificity phosphatase PhoE
MKKLVINPLKSLTKVHSERMMNLSIPNGTQIILMRHAESVFNYEIKNIEKLKPNMLESDFKKITSEIRFSKELLDCEITNQGKQQCYLAGNKFQDVNLKYVFVSPMRRALMTCENTLCAANKCKPEVIVLPYIFEKIEDSCDVLLDYAVNMREFSHYNWNYFKTLNKKSNYQLSYCDAWPSVNFEFDSFLNSKGLNIKEESFFSEPDYYAHLDIILKAMRILGEEDKFIESSFKTIERLVWFKNFINSFIVDNANELDRNQKILVIGHSILFKHLTAKFLDKVTYEPEEHLVLKNCQTAELSFL